MTCFFKTLDPLGKSKQAKSIRMTLLLLDAAEVPLARHVTPAM